MCAFIAATVPWDTAKDGPNPLLEAARSISITGVKPGRQQQMDTEFVSGTPWLDVREDGSVVGVQAGQPAPAPQPAQSPAPEGQPAGGAPASPEEQVPRGSYEMLMRMFPEPPRPGEPGGEAQPAPD